MVGFVDKHAPNDFIAEEAWNGSLSETYLPAMFSEMRRADVFQTGHLANICGFFLQGLQFNPLLSQMGDKQWGWVGREPGSLGFVALLLTCSLHEMSMIAACPKMRVSVRSIML